MGFYSMFGEVKTSCRLLLKCYVTAAFRAQNEARVEATETAPLTVI